MESTNVLVAIKNLYNIKNRVLSIGKSNARNRINSVGESLEEFVKDLFCDSLNVVEDKHIVHGKYFSYLGTKYCPPNIILKNSDAILVTSTRNKDGSFKIFNQYPKSKLDAEFEGIDESQKYCESWSVKDYLYVVGEVNENEIESLWLTYGDCFFASSEFYFGLDAKNKDLLDVTKFNFSSFCEVKHPRHLVKHTNIPNRSAFVNLLVLKDKYLSYPSEDRLYMESSLEKGFSVDDCLIHSPNNPSDMLEAKLISYKPVH